MGPFDGDRQREELEAYLLLWNLWWSSQRTTASVDNWESACEMLQTHYTVAQARQDSEVCAMRIRYLQIKEPLPRRTDFVHGPPYYRLPDAARQLAVAAYEYRLARRQNAKIESQVSALADLLPDGLQNSPDVSESDLTASYRAGDPAGIAAHVESVLTAMPLPRSINPQASVVYSPDSRELVVEYELPTVDVVPRAKSYRYVKSRETVVERARPVSQVKALYASAIAQLTLLSLAAILKFDSERHIDVVVFNGVVETQDPNSGQPIRPCLITVRVTRDALAEINLEDVDPSACLKHLSATVSQNPTAYWTL